MISMISLCLSWFMTALSKSLSSEVVARVVVVDEETRSGTKFNSPRSEYWFLFTQLNWGDICLMAVGASSLSRKEIRNFVSSFVTSGTKHLTIVLRKVAFSLLESTGRVVGTS